MAFGIGSQRIYTEMLPELGSPYLYNNTGQTLEKIHIDAFYFIPQNKASRLHEEWRELLNLKLTDLKKFHSLQFFGRSEISYSIFPAPIIGFKNNLFYDTETTQRGNPHGLINIAEEINTRVYEQDGDLHNEMFKRPENVAYPVMFIMYEGVGAAGGIIHESELETIEEIAEMLRLPESIIFKVNTEAVDGFFLINRDFLVDKFGPFGSSLLAHEFYHTIGIPDSYGATTSIPTTQDIMGIGRFKSIEKTYIDRDVLRQLGI